METLKKIDIKSYKSNSRLTNSTGIHFNSYENIINVYKELEKYKKSLSNILYEAKMDTTCSAEQIAEYVLKIVKNNPNFILCLKDPELTLFVKEILRYEGYDLKTATNYNLSQDGDYILFKEDSIKPEMLKKILKEQKKLIIDFYNSSDNNIYRLLGYYNNQSDEIINNIRYLRKLDENNDLLISSWKLKLTKNI